ncbi:protein phosphatase 2C [Iris pallida]|uniref:protein-serine/threonine phosphatase n=1 Tax=Iris pallida TaxID=29817 RepID=A0AAX6GRF8_IRIPA|nr:protein phosphatase 2C [Iris pallida]
MAEICCGVVTGADSAADACEPSPRSARRRRMEVRRFKFVAGVETMAISGDFTRKRQKLDFPVGKDGVLEKKLANGDEVEPSGDLEPPAQPARSDLCPRHGMTSVCGRRRDMEDAVSIRPDFVESGPKLHFFGVYDGHGCSHVAASCRDRMHKIVSAEIEAGATAESPDWKGVMERSFSRMDAEAVASPGAPRNASCRCELQMPKCEHVGSTAVVAVVSADRIVVSNCGDSRAVLCRRGAPVPLSVDHKPDRPDELNRIQEAGGRVIYWDGARVLGVLAMSRAIGDSYLKPYVVSEPEVTVTERTAEDECLILASDGLWDVVTNETACGVVRMCLTANAPSDKACADAAMLLTKLALARHSADNVSVVVVDLRRDS